MNLGNLGIEEWNFMNKKGKMNSPTQVVGSKTEIDRQRMPKQRQMQSYLVALLDVHIPFSDCLFKCILSNRLIQFSSVQFSWSVMSDSLQPHELQHARSPCPSPTRRVHSNSCPLSQWCHPTISSSVVPFSSCPQSLPASGSFPVSQLFASGGQSIGVSALVSVLPMNTQDWSPLE